MDGRREALIVASYEFEDPSLRRLRAPARDADALARVLTDPLVGDFGVRTLVNEPQHVIGEAVEEFFSDRAPGDLLLFHFSGHGIKDEDGELYFAASNTKARRLGATGLAASFVNRCVSRSRSRRVVLLLDCCYAGAFERGMVARAGMDAHVEEHLGGRGRAVITATSAMQYAFEGDRLADASDPGPSVFTRAIVDGLETGEADRDQDGRVGLDELYDYVYDRVREVTPNQTPGKWTFGIEGELYVARRRGPVTRPSPLPQELVEAMEHPLASVRLGVVQELAGLAAGGHAGLALGARQALERLAGDDSRRVAAAALAALGGQGGESAGPEPPSGSTGTVQAPPRPEPAEVASAPPAEAPAAVPPAEAPWVAPQPAGAPRPVPPAALGTPPAVAAAVHSPPAQAGEDVLVVRAGALALASAVIMLAGLVPTSQYGESDYALATSPWVLWYTLLVAALAAGAGACILSRSKRLVGLGLLMAVVPAATSSLLTIGSLWLHAGGLGPGYWLLLAANTILILCAGAVVPYLQREGVRVTRPPFENRYAFLVIIAGAVVALALVFDVVDIANRGSEVRFPDLWVLVIALVVPALGAAAAPHRFAVAVLAGWLVCGLAFLGSDVLLRAANGWNAGPVAPVSAALVLLAAAVIPFATAGRRRSA